MDIDAFYKWQESVGYNEAYKIKEAAQHLLHYNDFKYEEYGGLKEYLKSLIKDIQERGESAPKRPMYEFLKEIIELAVGKKVGVRFDRSQDAKDRFFQTGAYSTFIMELLSQPDGIVDFLNAITPAVPEDKRKEAVAQLEAEGIHVLPQPEGN